MTLYWLFPVAVTLLSRHKYFTLALTCRKDKRLFCGLLHFRLFMHRVVVPSIGQSEERKANQK